MTTSATEYRSSAGLRNRGSRVTGPVRPTPTPRPQVERQQTGELHLVTYLVGNLLFWALWSAVSISTGHWYWWPAVPLVAWTVVLAAHLWHVYRG